MFANPLSLVPFNDSVEIRVKYIWFACGDQDKFAYGTFLCVDFNPLNFPRLCLFHNFHGRLITQPMVAF